MNRRYNIDIVFHVKIRSPLLCFSPFLKLFFTEMFWECGQNLYIYILNHTPFFKFGVILLFPHTHRKSQMMRMKFYSIFLKLLPICSVVLDK